MVAYYRHNIVDWRIGTAGLSDGAYRLYHMIVCEIMLNEGPIRFHPRVLAGQCNTRPELITRYYLPELVRLGKVTFDGEFISNERCETELAAIREGRERSSRGGKKARANEAAARGAVPKNDARYAAAIDPPHARSSSATVPLSENVNNINDTDQAALGRPVDDKRGIVSTEAKASDATASDGLSEEGAKAVLFGAGLQWLVKSTGSSEAACRGLIGQWLKISRDDPDSVLAVMRKAQRDKPAEVKSFVTGVLRSRHAPKAVPGQRAIVEPGDQSKRSWPAGRAPL